MLRFLFHKNLSAALLLIVMMALDGAAFGANNGSLAESALWPLYQQISADFCNAENKLQDRVDPFSNELSPFQSPLAKTDPLYQKYFQVDQSAGEYAFALDQQKKQSWTLPSMLYFDGIAASTVGDYANVQKYFSRLLKDYPDYKRNAFTLMSFAHSVKADKDTIINDTKTPRQNTKDVLSQDMPRLQLSINPDSVSTGTVMCQITCR